MTEVCRDARSTVMTRRSARVVVNPGCGRGTASEGALALQDRLRAEGWDCLTIETEGGGDARRAAREAAAAGCEVVVAVGGDGTLHEVVHGALESGAAIAVAHVPAGTTNGVARALGIPLDVPSAVAVVTGGHVRRLDVGRVPGLDRYFLLAVTVGDPSRIVTGATRTLKSRWGIFAYYWAAARMMIRTRQTRMRIDHDGVRLQTRASGVVVANFGRLEIPQLELIPDSRPDDGKLEIAIVRARGLWDWLRISLAALTGRGVPPRVDLLSARRATVWTSRPRVVQADGEVIGITPVTIDLVPAALRFVAPPAEAS